MKEIMKKIRENCTLVEMVNDTKLEMKRLEMEIENLTHEKKKREEEVRATKSEAAKMMQIHGLNLGLETSADETKDKDDGKKGKAQNAF